MNVLSWWWWQRRNIPCAETLGRVSGRVASDSSMFHEDMLCPYVPTHVVMYGMCTCNCVCKCECFRGLTFQKAGQDISSLSSEPSLLPEMIRSRHRLIKRSIAHDPTAFCVCVIPNEMPLDSVELSACPRVGVWLSSTLSSRRCLDPALGNVALLNSTVFVLWIKLQHTQDKSKIVTYWPCRNYTAV